MRTIRVGSGAGSWGDDYEASRDLLSKTHVDYLAMDYLAEITMSILRRQYERNPALGYATDIVKALDAALPLLLERGTRVVTNAGGLNPLACARAIHELLARRGVGNTLRIAIVEGDDLMPDLDRLAGLVPFSSLDDGSLFDSVRGRIASANAYLGATPIRQALGLGADIVITGRCADVALTLGPIMHEFDWASDDWDRLAGGAVAGHLLECGPQSTGGNHFAWESVPGLHDVGYPLVEVSEDGTIVLTKAPGTGGRVDVATATEQLLHEIFDPRAVLTPDVTVDWTTLSVSEVGPDRVEIRGARGAPPPDSYKVSMTYPDGYRVVLMWPYAWPSAAEKATAALDKIARSVERLGLRLDAVRGDVFGCGAIHGPRTGEVPSPVEAFARFAARTIHRADAERLAGLQASMNYGPPGLAGHLGAGRGQVSPIYAHWGTLLPRGLAAGRARLVEADAEAE